MKGYEKTFGGDGNIYYLDCSDDFTDFKYEQCIVCQLYFNKVLRRLFIIQNKRIALDSKRILAY